MNFHMNSCIQERIVVSFVDEEFSGSGAFVVEGGHLHINRTSKSENQFAHLPTI
jgi:hypothetical protein